MSSIGCAPCVYGGSALSAAQPVQAIPSERPSSIAHSRSDARAERVHDVTIVAGSRLATALGATRLSVNSSHHQSLDRIAPGLAVTATAPDEVIEGTEWTGDGDWWMLGVQWHPEELTRTPEPWDASLFAAFGDALERGTTRSSNGTANPPQGRVAASHR